MKPIEVIAVVLGLVVSNIWWVCIAAKERDAKLECWASTGHPPICIDGRCFDQRLGSWTGSGNSTGGRDGE